MMFNAVWVSYFFLFLLFPPYILVRAVVKAGDDLLATVYRSSTRSADELWCFEIPNHPAGRMPISNGRSRLHDTVHILSPPPPNVLGD